MIYTYIVEKLSEELNALKTRVDELEKLIKDIKRSHGAPVKSEGDTAQHEKDSLVDVERLMESLVSKVDFEALLKRVGSLESVTQQLTTTLGTVEKKTVENTDEIERLKELLKGLEKKLSNKVDCEEYDKLLLLINQLRAAYSFFSNTSFFSPLFIVVVTGYFS